MANTTIPMLFTQGPLTSLWDTSKKVLKTTGAPNITNGKVYVGYDTSTKRAMLFTDIGNARYKFTADVTWSDIQNTPDLATQSELNEALEDIEGDIDSINTTIANIQANYLPLTAGANNLLSDNLYTPGVSFLYNSTNKINLVYNSNTESLDFNFV